MVGSFSGALPSQKVTEGSQGQLGANGNRADSAMAKVGLTARRRCRADTKVEHSEPMDRVRCVRRLPDKSYPGDNRLVVPKRPKRRHGSAPRCRLDLSWGWSRSQGFGCSPIKKSRELGLDRRETGWSPIYCRRRNLMRFVPSTRGPG